jgi:hypothetical protein
MKIRTMILPTLVALSWMALGTGARLNAKVTLSSGIER